MKAGKFVRANDIFEEINDGLYPCYGGNGLRGYTSSFTHYGKYSLIGRQGALCGNVNLVNGRFHATEHAVVVDHNDEINTDFLFYVLNNLNLNRYATGQAQPGLSVSSIERITFSFPLLPEQQKIADFITAVDDRIQTQNKIIEDYRTLKKGVMQKIFKQELKFKDENGNTFESWKEKRLGEFLIHKSKRNKKLEINQILSVSNSKGFILQSEQFDNHRVASKDVTNYKIVKKNDIAYNPSRINVGSIAILKDYEKGIVSPMYVVFGLKDSLELSYFENLITTHLFNHLVRVGCSGSVRDSLNFEDLESFKLKFPCLEEQQKIASTLSAIDKKIALEEDYLDKLKAQKKYFLQNMFI